MLCPDGIFQATLRPDAPGLASDPSAALTRHHLLPLDVVWPGGRAALSLAATRFHFALLSAATLTLVNRVSKRRVQDLVLSRCRGEEGGGMSMRRSGSRPLMSHGGWHPPCLAPPRLPAAG